MVHGRFDSSACCHPPPSPRAEPPDAARATTFLNDWRRATDEPWRSQRCDETCKLRWKDTKAIVQGETAVLGS